ncbi:hypothetical protein H0H81_000106 [Sphagnurus paluster]|uniref:Phosphoglycerate mutase-like protein n=1 Tax=Sphagnurus paluster TaxID=117069 RepID=A0A9P7KJ35_9AGAR|nr:hypothetical protein H0H81_000106 [Sphagnurus paluster]
MRVLDKEESDEEQLTAIADQRQRAPPPLSNSIAPFMTLVSKSSRSSTKQFSSPLKITTLIYVLLLAPLAAYSTIPTSGSDVWDTAHDPNMFRGATKHRDVNEMSYRPPQVPLDSLRYPAAPSDLRLEQVHVYVRHGERTPVGVRLARAPASIPEHWMMCKTARQFHAAVTNATEDGFLRTRKIVEREDGSTAQGEWCAKSACDSD